MNYIFIEIVSVILHFFICRLFFQFLKMNEKNKAPPQHLNRNIFFSSYLFSKRSSF